jgi:hypothetical protein
MGCSAAQEWLPGKRKKTNGMRVKFYERFPGRVFMAVLLVPLTRGVEAQPTQDLERCASIEVEEQRLACYDAAVREPSAPPMPDADDAEAMPTASEPGRSGLPVAEPRGSDSPIAEPDDARSEQRAGRRDRRGREDRPVTVVSVAENFTGYLVFTLDSGEVLVETSTSRARYPDPPFEAVLEPASFGSYFLTPENETSRIRVSVQR